MNLHENQAAFSEMISATAVAFNFEEFQIEKDYHVSLLLKALSTSNPHFVFKGGTSLSKCYDVINRFSEDIDLTILADRKVTNGQKRSTKDSILNSIEESGYSLLNDLEAIKTRRDFNKYLVGYPKAYNGGEHMVDHIIIETNMTYRPFPCERLLVSNFITELHSEKAHSFRGGMKAMSDTECQ